MNFLTAPAGTFGSVGSTRLNFSNSMPLASASVGALSGATAAGDATGAFTGAAGRASSPEPAIANANATIARMTSRPSRPTAIKVHSKRLFSRSSRSSASAAGESGTSMSSS